MAATEGTVCLVCLFGKKTAAAVVLRGESSVSPQERRRVVGPRKVSDIVVRPVNIQDQTPACAPLLEIGFIGLEAPPGQVLLMTGFYWSASAQPGQLIEIGMRVTDGNPSNFRPVASLSTIIPSEGRNFAGIQEFPVPVPLFRGPFKHLCLNRSNNVGTLGTGGFWLFGFFAPDT